jgi:hypothetical protein
VSLKEKTETYKFPQLNWFPPFNGPQQ